MPQTLEELAKQSGIDVKLAQPWVDQGTSNEIAVGAALDAQRKKSATPVGLFSSQQSVNQVMGDKQRLDTMAPLPQIEMKKPAGPTEAPKPEQPKEQVPQGVKFTFDEAYQTFNGDFSGITQGKDGNFYADPKAMERIGVQGIETPDTKQSGKFQNAVDVVDTQMEQLQKEFDSFQIEKDPKFQRHVEEIKQKYARIRESVEKVNYSRAQALQALGYRRGYGNDLQLGVEGEELRQANARIAEVNSEEANAILDAQTAFEKGHYEKFSKSMDALDKIRDNKSETLKEINQKLLDVQKMVMDQSKFQLDVLKYQLDLKKQSFSQSLDVAKFDQTAEQFRQRMGFDKEQFEFNKDKFIADYDLSNRKFNQDVKQFGMKYAQDQLKIDIQQSEDEFDRNIKFETLLNSTPVGQEISAGGLTGSGRKGSENMDGMTDKQKVVFNQIVNKYSTSPLVAASDRTVPLKTIIQSLEGDIKNSSKQAAFIYQFIQILDGYQSSVREGEIGFVQGTQGLKDKIANYYDQISQGTLLSERKMNELLSTAGILTEAIDKAAQNKEKMFKSQARVNGIEDQWVDFTNGFKGVDTAQQFNDYYTSHPELQGKIDQMITENKYTEEEVMQILGDGGGFNQGGTAPNAGAPKIINMNIGGKGIKVDQSISDKLAMADKEMFEKTGKHIQVNQSYRSSEQQAELYQKSKEGKIGRAAPPGSSFHEKGLAIDVTNWKEAEQYLRKYGLANELPDDKGHFSFGEFV